MNLLITLSLAGLLPLAGFASPHVPTAKLPKSATTTIDRELDRVAGGTEDEQVASIQAIQQLDPKGRLAALPLAKMLADRPARSAAFILNYLTSIGLAAKETLPDVQELVRYPLERWTLFCAAQTLAALGDPGNKDALRACLMDNQGGRKSQPPIDGIMQTHPAQVVPVLCDFLDDKDTFVRFRAAYYLHRYGMSLRSAPLPKQGLTADQIKPLVPKLLRACEDADDGVRAWAIAAAIAFEPSTCKELFPRIVTLRLRGADTPGQDTMRMTGAVGVQVVIDHLSSLHSGLRAWLLSILDSFGEEAIPVLVRNTCVANPRMRERVLWACARPQPAVREAVLERLTDNDAKVRFAAANALVRADATKAKPAIPILSESLFDRDPQVRSLALSSFASLGAKARSAAPALLRRTRSGDLDTRFQAATVLVEADRDAWPAILPVLTEMLRVATDYRRCQAAAWLCKLGPAATAALPDLQAMLKDPEISHQTTAAHAIIKIAPEASGPVIKHLIAMLPETVMPGVRKGHPTNDVIYVLEQAGPLAKEAVPALLRLAFASVDDQRTPSRAAVAAIHIDVDAAAEVYDIFRRHLLPTNENRDDDWLSAIATLGKHAKPLLTELAEALDSKQHDQQSAAQDALTMLGADALPALRAKFKQNPDCKRAKDLIDLLAR